MTGFRYGGIALIIKSRLFVCYAQLAIDCGEYALHLSECKHTSEQCVASIMAVTALVEHPTGLVGKGHAVIHTHGQLRILFFEDACQFNEISPSAQMAGLCEITVGEDVA